MLAGIARREARLGVLGVEPEPLEAHAALMHLDDFGITFAHAPSAVCGLMPPMAAALGAQAG